MSFKKLFHTPGVIFIVVALFAVLIGLVTLISSQGLSMHIRTDADPTYFQGRPVPDYNSGDGAYVGRPIDNALRLDACQNLQDQLDALQLTKDEREKRIQDLTSFITVLGEEIKALGGDLNLSDKDPKLTYPSDPKNNQQIFSLAKDLYDAVGDRNVVSKNLQETEQQISDTLNELERRGCNNNPV